MVDLGKKHDNTGGPVEATKSENKVYYPTVYISDKDLGLGEEDVGKEMMATVKVKVRGVSMNKREGDKKSHSIDLDILSIDLGKPMKSKTGNATQDAIEEGLEEQKVKKGK
ncbi:MAG: hypothetical protein WC738_04300 [Candidatus Omnitrophota bacterium]|jgi:hypothetical protein